MAKRNIEGDEQIEVFDEPANWAEAIQNPRIAKSINTLADAVAQHLPRQSTFQSKALIVNSVFSLLVLISVGAMGYLGILSKDVAGSLIGSLLGYWYGRYQASK